ncbi:MAG: hypothetical protein EA405_03765 [Rhodospirillales bacterium]|nr:MAG: hypothetical protein EA405_03765 [Rhodospirillales bacterium]
MQERSIALFLLGLVLFSPLVMRIFDRGADATVFGIPLLFAYVFLAWGFVILLLGLMGERLPPEHNGDDTRESEPTESA